MTPASSASGVDQAATGLSEEHRMVRDLVTRFVERDLMPLEPAVLAREAKGERYALTPEEEGPLLAKCRELGLWGLDVPEEFGGADLPIAALMAIEEEMGRTVTPFIFPPDSPNLHMLMAVATPEQKRKYMEPYARGTAKSAIAISEPGAGGDPTGMTTKAEMIGNEWVVNGRKIWVSRVPDADFTILMARVGSEGGHKGITAFIVEKGTKGFEIAREIPMLGGHRTYELVFDNMRLPADAILGAVGQGFAPMQLRLNVRRLQIGAWAIGLSRRALDMMCSHVKQRKTFGALLADRQAIQWWIADAATKIHACRLMVQDAAARLDRGEDVRQAASMIKVFATEMATEVIDNAMQSFGAMGVTKELPLQLMAQKVRIMRVYEGPTEVHRMTIARRILASVK
jgi:alkylation response protein AidB-like acyl-CoA dehydrogenase